MKRQIAYEHALPMLDERFQAKSVVQHFEPRIAAARSMIAMGGGSLEDIDAITARMREFGVRQYGEQNTADLGHRGRQTLYQRDDRAA